MPKLDNTRITESAQRRDSREGFEERTSRRRSFGSILGKNGDKTRAGQFNAELDKLLEKDPDFREVILYGKVADSSRASINYIGTYQPDNSIIAIAIIFENTGRYERDPHKRDLYFTYDMLTEKSSDNESLSDVMIAKIAADYNCSPDDVTVIDAQIVRPEFKVTPESVQHMAYTLGPLLENLAGYTPENTNFDVYQTYNAKMSVHPGKDYSTAHLHRSDFSIDVNQIASSNRKFSPTLLGDSAETDAGSTTLSGYVDIEFVGPDVDPDEWQGDISKFKPQQFVPKVVLSALDTSTSESYIYERGLMALAAIGELHVKNSAFDVLAEVICNDQSIDLANIVNYMWLPERMTAPKLKNRKDITDCLDLMVKHDMAYITVLHRAGDTSNGLLHMLARIGEGDEKYLSALLGTLASIDKDLPDRLASALGVDKIRPYDIVCSSTPRVFGTMSNNGRTTSLEIIDTLHISKVSGNGGDDGTATFGDWLRATSVEERGLSAEDSQEYQVMLMEEVYNGNVEANGAEYLLNPDFVSFLYNSLRNLFRDIDMFGFADCRKRTNHFFRTSGENLNLMRGNDHRKQYDDRRGSRFGTLRK